MAERVPADTTSAPDPARALLAVGVCSGARRSRRTAVPCTSRDADTFYRDRWSYDKVVRSTHGVNCTSSCSWKVYVKDGIITWESQRTDYPTVGPDRPEYEPRGCPGVRPSPGTPTHPAGSATRTPGVTGTGRMLLSDVALAAAVYTAVKMSGLARRTA